MFKISFQTIVILSNKGKSSSLKEADLFKNELHLPKMFNRYRAKCFRSANSFYEKKPVPVTTEGQTKDEELIGSRRGACKICHLLGTWCLNWATGWNYPVNINFLSTWEKNDNKKEALVLRSSQRHEATGNENVRLAPQEKKDRAYGCLQKLIQRLNAL